MNAGFYEWEGNSDGGRQRKISGGYNGTAEPCTVVLFGASGDLAKRKVIPAMYDLAMHNTPGSALRDGRVCPHADERRQLSGRALGEAAKSISEVGPIDPKQWEEFAANLHYSQGEYDDPEAYARLAKRLEELEASKKLGGNRLFYLSTPPEVYPHIVEQLGKAGTGAAQITPIPGCESLLKSLSGATWLPRKN